MCVNTLIPMELPIQHKHTVWILIMDQFDLGYVTISHTVGTDRIFFHQFFYCICMWDNHYPSE